MAGVDLGEKKPTGGTGPSWKRPRVKIRIDMTPMVDIAFLLLIFFMVTTVFRLPQAMEMILPANDPDKPPPTQEVYEKRLITFLVLENDSLAYQLGSELPKPLPWDSLRAKLNERRIAMFNGSLEELAQIDHLSDLAGVNLIKYNEAHGIDTLSTKLDSITDKAGVPRMSAADKQKLLDDLTKIDKLTVLARVHKRARYSSMVNLVDEFNVAKTTRFSIDHFTTYEDSLLRVAGFQTSGPSDLPEPEYSASPSSGQ
jgi:biopolymer transport protein ExbD